MALRTRLTLYYTGFFALALLLLGCGTYIAVKQTLEMGVQNDLKTARQQVVAIYQRSPASGLEFVLRNGVFQPAQLRGQPAAIFVNPNLVAQVFSPSGDFLGSSLVDSEQQVSRQVIPLPDDALELESGDELNIVQNVGGTRLRTLISPVQLANTGQIVGILQIARPLEDVDKTLNLLLSILIGGGLIALLITALGAALLSRHTLSPIDQVVLTAQGIVRAEDLGQRVPVPRSSDELQRLIITMNDLLERLEKLFTAQQRLVADVSHELRTPLAAMQGNLEVLARGAHRDPALLTESLVDMRQETARMIRMVNDLLLLARSEATVQIRCAPVELDALLLEIHRELRALASEVTLSIGEEDMITIEGDRDRIKQAMLNLGMNAIQYTPPGGTVTLSLQRYQGFACITVEDTGIGIAPADLPYIFERFYRADPSRRRTSGGAGLGLAIVKRVVEAHGGTVTVTSTPGVGSIFTIRLPLPEEETQPPERHTGLLSSKPAAALLNLSGKADSHQT